MQVIFRIHIREVSKNKNTIIETGLLRPFLVKIVFAKEKDAFFFYKERIQNPKLMTLRIYAACGVSQTPIYSEEEKGAGIMESREGVHGK